jgi:hypothetical protein
MKVKFMTNNAMDRHGLKLDVHPDRWVFTRVMAYDGRLGFAKACAPAAWKATMNGICPRSRKRETVKV